MKLYPGVYKFSHGIPEPQTPISLRTIPPAEKALRKLENFPCPISIQFTVTQRGTQATLPFSKDEHLYGFGLQLKSFEQTGKKRVLRTNADSEQDCGDSHAPVPFFVSTHGYGVLVDSARQVSFYCGCSERKQMSAAAQEHGRADTPQELYEIKKLSDHILIDIPHAPGVDIYVFAGSTLRDAVCRYNLFSGGGPLVPLWGLGILYRGYQGLNQDSVLRLAQQIRADGIPCDMFGFEPGWHTHAYSCSFQWNSTLFPDHASLLQELRQQGFHINLWEQAFVSSSAPFYNQLRDKSGNYLVWEGLVPDFAQEEVKSIYADHQKRLIEDGVDGFKLDECDSSDYTGGWSFPECAEFPSGMDGEQMHQQLGVLFQESVRRAFADKQLRTYSQVRASHALAAPYPFVLYSDLYNHKDFIRGLAVSGFSGLLWSPEVRQTKSGAEYLRRLQSVICSPLALVNAWMIPTPPWRQFDEAKNKRGEFLPSAERTFLTQATKNIFSLRMSLIPYLYDAFFKYHESGLPVFRALVMDWPQDSHTFDIDDEIMIGDSLLAAPVVCDEEGPRAVYLPEGEWYDFYTNEKLEGAQWVTRNTPLTQLPLFVKSGSLLALAQPKQHIDEEPFRIHLRLYGAGSAQATLVEDDGTTLNSTHTLLHLCANTSGYTVRRIGVYPKPQYEFIDFSVIL